MAEREASPLPLEVRARLAELELELSEGDITQKGYEKKRSKLIRAYVPHPGDVHSEAVQAVLARHVESKVAVPMPSKRRSLVVQTSMDAYTPPDSSSGSEEEAGPGDDMPGMEHWMTRPAHLGPAHLGSTSSSSSSTQSGGSGNAGRLADSLAHAHLSHPHLSHPHLTQSHHVSAHHSQTHHGIGHLSLKRKPALGVAENGALRNRGVGFDMVGPATRSQAAPSGGGRDVSSEWRGPGGGKLWSRSVKLAFNILHKLGSKQEPMVRPGDRVALVFPNNDPVAFMVAFYGCLLAEVVPVPIEVPLTRKIGFLLGSCGVTVALTSDACHKGLPKSATGEIPQFRGWPKLLWFVTESKHLSKPPRDWFPHIKDANSDTAYIETKRVRWEFLGVTVMRIALLTHCQALTQSCGYTEAETIVNVLDFKKDVGLWHGILTSVMNMMHVISVPYSLMKVNPLSWIQKVYHFKAKVACVKSRDMHWALVAHREQKDISLSSLRMLLVADGSNPWSISSCDAFLNVFQRPVEDSSQPPGRGVISMQGLSYSLVASTGEERCRPHWQDRSGHCYAWREGPGVCVKPDGVWWFCPSPGVWVKPDGISEHLTSVPMNNEYVISNLERASGARVMNVERLGDEMERGDCPVKVFGLVMTHGKK
ncbi:unnamed protein product [Coregonus sp. 'balchen']|nr:unnamed protein product [Coregonus sp. 'balchen']